MTDLYPNYGSNLLSPWLMKRDIDSYLSSLTLSLSYYRVFCLIYFTDSRVSTRDREEKFALKPPRTNQSRTIVPFSSIDSMD